MRPSELDETKVTAADGTYFLCDCTHYPMIFARLLGEPSVAVATAFGVWITPIVDFAASEGKRIIVVNDFSQASPPPSPVRKVMSDDGARLHANPGFGYWVAIVPNALLRGLLTALVWASGDGGSNRRTHYAVNIQVAIRKALSLYEKLQHEPPNVDPDTYVFPADRK